MKIRHVSKLYALIQEGTLRYQKEILRFDCNIIYVFTGLMMKTRVLLHIKPS